MKIAQIAPPWITISPHNYGGTENVIYHLTEELVALGHNVTLFAPADACTTARQVSFIPKSLTAEGIPWQANLKAYYHLHKSFEYVAEHEFDIVHTHLSSSADMYIFPLAATLPAPHVTTLHSYFPFDRTSDNWVGDADDYFMEWAQHVPLVTISESARTHIPASAHFAGIVHHGIQMQKYCSASSSPKDYFVWLGQFVFEQGAHLAIEAAKRVGIPLILAGVKEPQNRDAMHYYQHLVEPHIDGEFIRYIGPALRQEKIDLLRQARALLNPIQWEEPSGMVIIEAMALGCPVISFAHGAASEIIEHGQSGFLVHSVEEMAQCIAYIDDLKREFVRDHAERYFSSRVMTRNYLEIYQNVISTEALRSVPALFDTSLVGAIPTNRRDILSA